MGGRGRCSFLSLSLCVGGGVGLSSTSLYVSLSYVDFYKFSRGFRSVGYFLLGNYAVVFGIFDN